MIILLIALIVLALITELRAYRERYLNKYRQYQSKDWTYCFIRQRGHKRVISFDDVRK